MARSNIVTITVSEKPTAPPPTIGHISLSPSYQLITLYSDFTLNCKVTDVNGNPLSGVRVSLYYIRSDGSLRLTQVRNTDSNGTCKFGYVISSPGVLKFIAKADNVESNTATVEAVSTHDIYLKISPRTVQTYSGEEVTFTVSVKVKGSPAKRGTKVELYKEREHILLKEAYTDSSGNAYITVALPVGEYYVQAYCAGASDIDAIANVYVRD